MVPGNLKLADLTLLQKGICWCQLLVGLHRNWQLVRPRYDRNWQDADGHGQSLNLRFDTLGGDGDLVKIANIVASVGWRAIPGNEFVEKIYDINKIIDNFLV